MAAKPAAREVLVLQIDEIRVPEGRFRTLKAEQAAAIGASIAVEGQFDPIAVAQLPGEAGYVLVDGWHRLEGSRQAGIATIEATLVQPKKAVRVKREVISGLARAAEDVFDRAAAVDALARLAREEAGVPAIGDLRRRADAEPRLPKVIEAEADSGLSCMTNMLRWDLHVAVQLGLGERMVRRLAVVHERIPAHLKDKLRELGLANELMPLHELARYPVPFIEKVVAALTAKVMSIAEAIDQVQARPKVDAFTKFSSSVFRKAQSLTTAQRRDFLADWLETYHPDGRVKRKSAFDDDANKGSEA
jgi:uncharacterized ParB-like nuclease family protein